MGERHFLCKCEKLISCCKICNSGFKLSKNPESTMVIASGYQLTCTFVNTNAKEMPQRTMSLRHAESLCPAIRSVRHKQRGSILAFKEIARNATKKELTQAAVPKGPHYQQIRTKPRNGLGQCLLDRTVPAEFV